MTTDRVGMSEMRLAEIEADLERARELACTDLLAHRLPPSARRFLFEGAGEIVEELHRRMEEDGQ